MPPEGSDLIFDHRHNAADRVFLDCRGAGILVRHARCTGRALLAVKLVAVHGAGREREPGQDAWMPPRLEEGLRDDRVPGDPGRSRAEGRTPARDHPADLDADRRPGPRNVAAGLARISTQRVKATSSHGL